MSYVDKEKGKATRKRYNQEHQEQCNETTARWRQRNSIKARERDNELNHLLKIETLSHYAGGIAHCAFCNITDIDILTIDHIDNNGNEHRRSLGLNGRSGVRFYRWLRYNNFPEGYQTLCFNCNMKKHMRRIRGE